MISIFPLWTFHLYVATFQQHLHMVYIYLSWSDIPELVVLLDRGLLLTRTPLNPGLPHIRENGKMEIISFVVVVYGWWQYLTIPFGSSELELYGRRTDIDFQTCWPMNNFCTWQKKPNPPVNKCNIKITYF